jgi:hypothetical protein
MKTFLMFVLIAVASHATANTLPVENLQAVDSSATASLSAGPVQTSPRLLNRRAALGAPAKVSGLKGTVVKDIRATKAFVQKSVEKDERADRGLMLLAALGLIVLQLRRKHKSLPQRPIAPYA